MQTGFSSPAKSGIVEDLSLSDTSVSTNFFSLIFFVISTYLCTFTKMVKFERMIFSNSTHLFKSQLKMSNYKIFWDYNNSTLHLFHIIVNSTNKIHCKTRHSFERSK